MDVRVSTNLSLRLRRLLLAMLNMGISRLRVCTLPSPEPTLRSPGTTCPSARKPAKLAAAAPTKLRGAIILLPGYV